MLLGIYIEKNARYCQQFLNVPSGPVDVQWTSIERSYRACGRPEGTFDESLVDVPNETQLVRPNCTKMDIHFRPLWGAMHRKAGFFSSIFSRIRTELYPYFLVYGQTLIFCSYTTSNTILFIYEKMWITKSRHFNLFYICNYFNDQNVKVRHDLQRCLDLLQG